jgi:hypothetical protein
LVAIGLVRSRRHEAAVPDARREQARGACVLLEHFAELPLLA